jgi:hypothetical protein
MPLELVEDAAGDPRNARFLAAASQFAYSPAEPGAAAFQSELGLTGRLVSADNTQAYLATNDNHVVVAFRGSQDPTSIDGLKDWLLTNALNLLIVPEGKLSTEFVAAGVGAKWHQGFVSAITEIWDGLHPQVEAELKAKDRPLWVTGHSLGGALALLGAWLFKRKFLSVHQVYTFGAPMVGNKVVAEAFGREFPNKIFRYVNPPDPVPLLPMMSLVANDFTHCDTAVRLADAGGAADLIEFVRQLAGQTVGGVLSGNVSEEVWGAVKGRVAAHLLDDYRKLIQ